MVIESHIGAANPQTHVLWVRRNYLDLIRDHQKTLEIRVGYPIFRDINISDILRFNSQLDCERIVTRIGQYDSLEMLAENEDLARIDPTITPEQLILEGRRLLSKIGKFGLLAFDLGTN